VTIELRLAMRLAHALSQCGPYSDQAISAAESIVPELGPPLVGNHRTIVFGKSGSITYDAPAGGLSASEAEGLRQVAFAVASPVVIQIVNVEGADGLMRIEGAGHTMNLVLYAAMGNGVPTYSSAVLPAPDITLYNFPFPSLAGGMTVPCPPEAAEMATELIRLQMEMAALEHCRSTGMTPIFDAAMRRH